VRCSIHPTAKQGLAAKLDSNTVVRGESKLNADPGSVLRPVT
jgi:hypothetical protein